MTDNIKTMINNLVTGDKDAAQDMFNQIFSMKAAEQLDKLKMEVGSNAFESTEVEESIIGKPALKKYGIKSKNQKPKTDKEGDSFDYDKTGKLKKKGGFDAGGHYGGLEDDLDKAEYNKDR
jgi:hypothetical protein